MDREDPNPAPRLPSDDRKLIALKDADPAFLDWIISSEWDAEGDAFNDEIE